jgi:hypothetical protein
MLLERKPYWQDNDGKDFDLDSDNDGIYDLVESGSNARMLIQMELLTVLFFGPNGLAIA